ncbi:hypothetical protein AB0K74_16295 [Streptomyces sp. NPDC056159]|uniref:hypothetical protein n=1 Tax=Streptomyces sp. NPDC056159 TaxID=3155537 RepID=UPI0034224173
MTLFKAMQMIEPFQGLPHFDTAVRELVRAASKGKRELHEAAYRIRNAYAAYAVAVNYGKAEA